MSKQDLNGGASGPAAGEKSGERFSSLGFIMSAIGSAIGLGNLWKFPYITGIYGGAAFVLLFIICLIIVGMPVLLAEMAIGRAGRGNASTSFLNLSGSKRWSFFGFLGVFGSFMITSFYSVIAGWTLHYALSSFTGALYKGTDYAVQFQTFTSGYSPIAWQFLILGLSGWVIARGVSGGIEKFNKVLIPALAVVLLILMARALTLPGAGAGIEFFLKPDFSKLTGESALVALGQAFFSMSIGMGVMITYGSYVRKEQSLGKATVAVTGGNLLYALIAGLIVFPTTFSFGLEPAQGPGLVFVVLPAAFSSMPLGAAFGGLFFILLAIAAFTSILSLLEVPVAFAMDRWKWSRLKATSWTTAVCFIVGVPSALSVGGVLSGFKIGGKTVFDSLDFVTSNVLLPVGGLVVTLFIAYASKRAMEEAGLKGTLLRVWAFLLRIVIPPLIVLIFLYSVGIIS
ncbi:sodium-dependent transporter [Paenibacillus sp. UNC499MF]|uniref:sodium-dependent transporter n=1 Tax=Paenibacillus sp. UNC499MF TaxID=1502751 RepID=UPI0008A01F24|nr:sodium-dependent transporter [Paenibacillus sp. UNC499MF]SEG29105.1 neurotransmitter:Na+ symporter, NSS family [Paenibacillus sp. UNC499MF]